jgi:hypothetical protein
MGGSVSCGDASGGQSLSEVNSGWLESQTVRSFPLALSKTPYCKRAAAERQLAVTAASNLSANRHRLCGRFRDYGCPNDPLCCP